MANDDQTPDDGNSGNEDEVRTSGAQRRRGRAARGSGGSGGSDGGGGKGKSSPVDPSKLRFFTLIPDNTNIDFVGNRRKGLLLSLILVLLSLGMMAYNSLTGDSALNFGIDFEGGSSVRIALTQEADVQQMRDLLDDAGYSGSSAVAVPDADNEMLIRVKETVSISDDELTACRDSLSSLAGAQLLEENGFVHPNNSSKIFMKFTALPTDYAFYSEIERLMGEAGCDGTASAGVGKPDEFPVEFALIGVGNEIAKKIDEALGEGTVDHIVASETVGPKVGNQLKTDGIQAMLFAILFIFLFVMIRFDLRFAPGGIVALVHDALIVVGAFAITGKEFNLQSIAAVLTIIGYSINDTIVVFDRVRERVALHRDDPIEQTTNAALNETLSRTILTSTTTLIVVVATWVLGSGPIKDFAFALFVGLIAGTYSSLYVASPVFLWVNDKMYKGRGHLLTAEKDAARGTGTLLGPQIEGGEDPDAGAVFAEDLDGEGPRASADVDAAIDAEHEVPAIKVEDVDKSAGERKTRRRRRKPKA